MVNEATNTGPVENRDTYQKQWSTSLDCNSETKSLFDLPSKSSLHRSQIRSSSNASSVQPATLIYVSRLRSLLKLFVSLKACLTDGSSARLD
jgi:hypothetical protein